MGSERKGRIQEGRKVPSKKSGLTITVLSNIFPEHFVSQEIDTSRVCMHFFHWVAKNNYRTFYGNDVLEMDLTISIRPRLGPSNHLSNCVELRLTSSDVVKRSRTLLNFAYSKRFPENSEGKFPLV
jgi:hypothetical protein